MILLLITAKRAMAIKAIIVDSYNRNYHNKNSGNNKNEGKI